jgi:hypothetical protein
MDSCNWVTPHKLEAKLWSITSASIPISTAMEGMKIGRVWGSRIGEGRSGEVPNNNRDGNIGQDLSQGLTGLVGWDLDQGLNAELIRQNLSTTKGAPGEECSNR